MKSTEFLKELRAMSPAEIKEKGRSACEEMMKLRMRVASGQPEQGNRITLLRKQFAQAQTILNQKKSA